METVSNCNCEKKNVLCLLQTRKFFILDLIPTCLLCNNEPMDCEDDSDDSMDEETDEEDMDEEES